MYFQRRQYLSMHIFPCSNVCPLLVVFVTVCENVRGVIMLQCAIFYSRLGEQQFRAAARHLVPNPKNSVKQSHFEQISSPHPQQQYIAIPFISNDTDKQPLIIAVLILHFIKQNVLQRECKHEKTVNSSMTCYSVCGV